MMAFPFDLLDLFVPEIAHWMAGKSTSDKRRFLRAGLGLISLGILLGLACFFLDSFMGQAFGTVAWAVFVSFLFAGSGAGLLACVAIDRKMN